MAAMMSFHIFMMSFHIFSTSAATCWVHMQHLPGTWLVNRKRLPCACAAAYASSWSIVYLYLFH